LNDNEYNEYLNVFDYYNLIALKPDTLCNWPDSLALTEFWNLYYNSTGIVQTFACNILQTYDSLVYEEPVILPDLTKSSQTINYSQNSEWTEKRPVFLQIFPNPFKGFFHCGTQFGNIQPWYNYYY
jgi:hypothetical protein